jgi:hypothetical protein
LSATATAVPPDVVRKVSGLVVEKHKLRDGSILWRSVERPPPIEQASYDEKTGQTVVNTVYQDERVVWQGSVSPAEARARFQNVRLQPFSQWAPDAEHDEFERLCEVSEFFAAKFAAQFKIQARAPIGPLPLGEIRVSVATFVRAKCSQDEVREYLRRHAKSDSGAFGRGEDHADLSEDQLWCPAMFSQAVQNAVAIRTGFGLVRSHYITPEDPQPALQFTAPVRDDRRRAEEIEVWTILEGSQAETMIFAPRFDQA